MTPTPKYVATTLAFGLLVGVCAAATVAIILAPVIAAVTGLMKGAPEMLMALALMPWWTPFVIAQLDKHRILAAIRGSA